MQHSTFWLDTTTTWKAGMWLEDKYRAQAKKHGVQHAARNCKKQGLPIELALAILGRKP